MPTNADTAAEQLWEGSPAAFLGDTARHSLGWVSHVAEFEQRVTELDQRWHRDRPARHERTIVLGMGGSASPASMFGAMRGSTTLEVVDTSNPDTIAAVDFHNVNVIAASKSGGTIETVTTLAWALAHGLETRDLSIITDPGTSLAELATSLDAALFYGDPNTGGRFGALSPMGILPALAAGWSVDELLETSFTGGVEKDEFVEWFVRAAQSVDSDREINWFSLEHPPRTGTGELWLEQLVAESTGKDGRGVVPVLGAPAQRAPQRASVARDVYKFHVEIAAMAWAIGVDPFNQPDVEGAKRNVFGQLAQPHVWSDELHVPLADLDRADEAGYVALQVFAPLDHDAAVFSLRERLAGRFPKITAALGPRFLHSTGQLHKGGPASMVAIQVQVKPTTEPQRISGRHFSFHDLHAAQAHADAVALRSAGRTVIELRVESLDQVASLFGQ